MTSPWARLRRLFRRSTNPPTSQPRDTYCYLGDHRALVLTRRGDMMYVDTRDIGMTPHLALHGQWEPHVELAIAGLMRPRQRVVEVGANMGYHTLAMARAIGPGGVVHAFEANPQALGLLRGSLAINGLADRVTLHPLAALDTPGEVEFAADPEHLGSGHWAPPILAANYSNRFTVPATSLDLALLDRLGQVDVLRMDAEGSEPQVLRGAEKLIQASPRLRIVTEWSTSMMAVRSDLNELVAWLQGHGLRFWRIKADGGLEEVPARHLTALDHCDLVMAREEP